MNGRVGGWGIGIGIPSVELKFLKLTFHVFEDIDWIPSVEVKTIQISASCFWNIDWIPSEYLEIQ